MSRLVRMLAFVCTLSLMLVPALVGSSRSASYEAPTASLVNAGMFEVTLGVKAGTTGAPSGFLVQWMPKADYDFLGGWPPENDPGLTYCSYVGQPTLNLWGASDFRLAPGARASVQPGDEFDQTGIITNSIDVLEPGRQYVFRVKAIGDAANDGSGFSATVTALTSGKPECTQGFWKNHEDVWPPSCIPMLLGTVDYTKAQLLAIFNQPANGNGLISLAHQLIAAKLNLCNGSDGTPIAITIANADALIGGLVVPPVGGGTLDPSSTDALTEKLDQYNNGELGGVIDCPTAVRNASWGRLKQLYR